MTEKSLQISLLKNIIKKVFRLDADSVLWAKSSAHEAVCAYNILQIEDILKLFSR